ncbi:hypothetical protein FNV43_RR12911 [Rhamnella rubrinervis]|uniref:Uncharacterized protein n=1 Tax=Rhamnella rubrinervis TaxID=2594499 RepID=A0A8K0H049_9ROSA|nr:hypothetical protein FNV43_RR12911 [Rhamnella rubrinervis]
MSPSKLAAIAATYLPLKFMNLHHFILTRSNVKPYLQWSSCLTDRKTNTPIQGNIAGTSVAGGGATVNDTRFEQLMELLRDYIQRFNDMKVEIIDCRDIVAYNTFKRGLLPGSKIYDYMVRKKPRNLLDILQKTQSFVELEEEIELNMQRVVKEGQVISSSAGVGRADLSIKAWQSKTVEYSRNQRIVC